MAAVRFESSNVQDWKSFHEYCMEVFGFPDFYGKNMDAWIDCMSSLDEEGMTRFLIKPDEMLQIEITETEAFRTRLREIFDAFVDCSAFVNQRYTDSGRTPALSLVFVN
ncbi:MAG: barstar family protein [Acidobacteria bacterium]|nr:barstar family protein [Acidobacteriota bacterium]